MLGMPSSGLSRIKGKTMNIAHWDKDEAGNLRVFPLVSCESAPMRNGMAGFIRLQYFLDQTEQKLGTAQLGVTVNELGRLITELQVLETQLRDNLAADRPIGKPS
jgi:hypothetical protein